MFETKKLLVSPTFAGIVIMVIAGLASPNFSLPASAGTRVVQQSAPYRLQVDDVIEIGIVGETDMLRQVSVLPDGTISYLSTGDLQVRGLTLSELRRKLVVILSKQFVRPQVIVSVLRRTPPTMSVVGSVKLPGSYPVSEKTHLLDMVAAAGSKRARFTP